MLQDHYHNRVFLHDGADLIARAQASHLVSVMMCDTRAWLFAWLAVVESVDSAGQTSEFARPINAHDREIILSR